MTQGTLAGPIIDAPLSWDFGNEQTDYRMLVIGATRNVRNVLGTHPRLLFGVDFPTTAPSSAYGIAADQSGDWLTDANGSRPRHHRLSALRFWSRSTGTSSNGDPTAMVTDPGGARGWVIKLANGANSGGLAMRLVLGRELQPGDRLKIVIRHKNSDTQSWANFIAAPDKSMTSMPLTHTGAYVMQTFSTYLDPAHWSIGDTLAHDIYAYAGAAANGDLLIDTLDYEVMRNYVAAADDPTAAAAGVAVGDTYQASGVLRVRLA